MFIVSCDPGLSSGFSTYNNVTGEFATSEEVGFAAAAQHLEWLLADGYATEMVCENFVVTQSTARKTQQPDALKLIGVAEYLCIKYRHKFTLQQPAQRKAGENLLKKMSWYVRTKDMHSNSSSGHLLVYCLNNGLLLPQDRARLVSS